MYSFPTISLKELQLRGIDLKPDKLRSNYGYLIDEDGHGYSVACFNPLQPLTNLDEFKHKDIILFKIIRDDEGKTLDEVLPCSGNFIFLQKKDASQILKDLLINAIKHNATDIHIDTDEKTVDIRYRIQGDLKQVGKLPLVKGRQLINSIKVLSNIDVTITRKPQDGKLQILSSNKDIQCRCATIPTQHGEKIVLRILDANQQFQHITNLNFPRIIGKEIEKILFMRTGSIIFSGPTGSGKSTSMYAILREINSPKLNIVTIEDPIEYQVPGINQVEVNEKAGITFYSILRAVLRVDPDVVLIGETRDSETAELMIGAGITGHLVLSTLHAPNCVGTINRLLDMGIEPYKINGSIKYIISQRIVKKLCPKCKEKEKLKHHGKEVVHFKARGCNYCEDGYSNRFAIFELLKMNDAARNLITRTKNDHLNQKSLQSYVLNPLEHQAKNLLKLGIIDYKEYLKLILSLE